jgi:hypothetical protein
LPGVGDFNKLQRFDDPFSSLHAVKEDRFGLFDRFDRLDQVDDGFEGRVHAIALPFLHAFDFEQSFGNLRDGNIAGFVFFDIHIHQRLGAFGQLDGAPRNGGRKQVSVEIRFFKGFRRYFFESHDSLLK